MEKEVDVTILPGTLDLVFWLVSLVAVIILLLWDVWKAYKRRAFWMPGQALLLSALIIQLLSFIDYSHIRLYSGSSYQTKEVVAILVKNQLVIDSGRLMLCVLIAYLLPEMVRSGSITVWSNLAALALSIIFHVVSELRSIWKMEKRNESLSAFVASSEGFERIFFYLSSTILIVVIIYLLCLLIRAVMVGRRIRGIMSQKISSALSCSDTPSNTLNYIDIKVHVLKCWLVARLCQPDYVFVRTGLCSMAFIFVTVCIGLHVIKLTYLYFTDNESLNSVTKGKLVLFVIVGQSGIVLIGWIFLLFRYMTPRMHGNIFSEEYFETMSIEDALDDLPACLTRLFFGNKRNQEKTLRCLDEKFRDINTSCGNARDRLKQFFQFFPMQNTPSPVTSTEENSEFSMYQLTLERLLISGESELSLWEANQLGFTKVKGYMEQVDGKCCASELTDLLGLVRVTAEVEADREKAKQLQQANENSWKKRAIQLINCMIPSKNSAAPVTEHVIEKAMQCYIQAWEYMNFVDGLKEEVKSLGRQADKEFDSLQHTWNKEQVHDIEQPPSVRDPGSSASQSDQIDLANVYFACMEGGLKEAVLVKCRKLAEEGKEEEILDVAFLSAKARALLHKVREGHNTDPASTSSHIPTVSEQVGEGHNTDQASTSSHILTVSEQYVNGNTNNTNSNICGVPISFIDVVGEGNDPENPVEPRDNTKVGDGNGQAELAVVGEGNDPENPVEPRDNTKVREGNGQAELLPGRLLRRVGSAPFGKGNGQAGLRRIDIRFHSGDKNVIERHGCIHGNPIIFGDNSIRSRRPNDSLTDQTEIAVAPKDDKPKDE